MREIKFRAWDKEKKQIFDVSNINFIGEEIDVYTNDSSSGDWIGFDYIELMQYTGLKDKNGVEIYEGDIVKVMDRTFAIVKYSRDRGAYYLDCERKIGDVGLICQYDMIKRVGNVYETPELVK